MYFDFNLSLCKSDAVSLDPICLGTWWVGRGTHYYFKARSNCLNHLGKGRLLFNFRKTKQNKAFQPALDFTKGKPKPNLGREGF